MLSPFADRVANIDKDDTKSLFSGGRKASGASIASFKTLPVPGGGFSSRSYKSLMPGGLKDRFSKHGGEPSGTSTLPSKVSIDLVINSQVVMLSSDAVEVRTF